MNIFQTIRRDIEAEIMMRTSPPFIELEAFPKFYEDLEKKGISYRRSFLTKTTASILGSKEKKFYRVHFPDAIKAIKLQELDVGVAIIVYENEYFIINLQRGAFGDIYISVLDKNSLKHLGQNQLQTLAENL